MKLPFGSVLCATDLSSLGNLAADVAYRLVADGGTVHLLHVDAPPNVGNPLYPDERPKDAPSDAEIEAHRAELRRRLQDLVPTSAAGRGVRTEIDLVESDEVVGAIETEFRRRAADVIALASHGRWGLARLVHGESVAVRLLHRPDIDVIVVHTDRP
jgi:nucleotide-binding universal stress UspA family protein